MAKRKPSKSKGRKSGNRPKLSAKSRKNLIREASNARRRLRQFSLRPDADNYIIPEPSDYTLANLLIRIENGETTRSIMRELRNLTADKIRSGKPLNLITETGYKLSKSEVSALTKAVNQANKNIRKAKQEYGDLADLIPNEFSVKELSFNAVGPETIQNRIEDLKLYTPENLQIVSINEMGEAGTVAEYEWNKRILERENARREKLRRENDPREQKGFFLQQSDFDTAAIDIASIPDMETLRRRATTWDDPARVYRANLFLSNYEKALDMFAGVLINNGYWNSTIEDRIAFIRDTISKLYSNEKAISYISTRIPNIDISLLYGGGNGDIDFSSIYDAWCDVDDMYG